MTVSLEWPCRLSLRHRWRRDRS